MSAGPLPRLAIRVDGGHDPLACVELAKAAETAGLSSVWFAENPFTRGALPAMAACAAVTTRIGIGIGVFNPYNRHPTLMAMEFAALDELARGRAVLGIGSGIAGAVSRMGIANDRPIAALRDAVHIVRAMLAGERVTYRGRVFAVDGVRLGFPPPRRDPPIYLAAMNPQSLRLCGRIADGLIISNMTAPGYSRQAVAIVREAAAAAGRPPPGIVQYVPCVARPERSEARRIVKEAVGAMLIHFWPADGVWPASKEAIVAASGIARREFAAALDRLRAGANAGDTLDERFADAFAIAGTASDCLDQARRYRAAGVTELALTFGGAQPREDIAYLGAALAAAG
jgi:5,10-methylenetetrahydromethanopterin reductase